MTYLNINKLAYYVLNKFVCCELIFNAIFYKDIEGCDIMEEVVIKYHECIDSYITVALDNLKLDDEKIKAVTLEVDRLMFEGKLSIIKKKATKINKRVFSELF